MSTYVKYDESIYRTGHRMFGLTDPFTASHGLSGINHSYGGFGPWMLHGNQPFTERGGYTLSGLGAAPIPDGSIVTYVGKWTTGHTAIRDQDPQYLVDAVVAAINSDGALAVLQQPTTLNSSLGTQIGNILGQTQTVPVTLTLQVANGQGFGDASNLISIINHYVYVVSGMMPQSGTLTSVRPPSDPGAGAGSPDFQTAGIDPTTGLPYGVQPTQPTDLATWFEQNALWIGLGIGALVLLPKVL